MSKRTLYICYFWIDESLVQTQVLPYLREIQKGGTEVSLLTFERDVSDQKRIEKWKNQLADEGIEWNFLKYHKTPSVPATIFDVLNGAFFIWKKLRREKIAVLHARVHVPMLMAALARKLPFGKKPKLLFDIRGFFPEEYTDAGVWKENGWIYKSVKQVEKWLLKEADAFVVLTEKARQILFPESQETGFDKFGRPVEVIPCCVDIKRFESNIPVSPKTAKERLNVVNRNVIVYVGSFGGWYLTDETMNFLQTAKEHDATTFALILTQSDAQTVSDSLRKRGFSEEDFFVGKVLPSEIPFYLSAGDFAVSFIKPCYSKQASSPTKNAEYLACGMPLIANDGIGDTTVFTKADQTGIIINEFNRESYQSALAEMKALMNDRELLAVRCRQSAKNRFDLESVGGERYRRIYQNLAAKN